MNYLDQEPSRLPEFGEIVASFSPYDWYMQEEVDGNGRDGYRLTGDSTLQIKEPIQMAFNQYIIAYSSDVHLKASVTYCRGKKEYTENFYLEAGENQVFSSLIDGYTKSVKVTELQRVTLAPLLDEEATVIVTRIMTANVPVYDEEMYLENDRFRLGASLKLGGAVFYFEDKADGDDSVGNLINYHDTGRLLQQTYYGTNLAPYNASSWHTTAAWPYNALQGGDQYQNASKVVAVWQDETHLYIKCRALDYAKNNTLSDCYQTCLYTMEEDCVRTDVRAIDFSSYDHPVSEQETPCCFVISHLGTFVCYTGDKPWTGDTLSRYTDLVLDSPDVFKFNYADRDGECWAAWIDEKDWGFGIYAPDVPMIQAGRFRYNGTKSPKGESTNYIGSRSQFALTQGEPIVYSYLITAGQLSDIRSVFEEHQNYTDNTFYNWPTQYISDFTELDFSKADTESVLCDFHHSGVVYDEDKKVAKIFVNAKDDPYFSIRYASGPALSADNYRYITIEYRLNMRNSPVSGSGELYFRCGDMTKFHADYSVAIPYTRDNEYQTLIIDLSKTSWWQGDIGNLRYDVFQQCGVNDVLYLKSIRLWETDPALSGIEGIRVSVT